MAGSEFAKRQLKKHGWTEGSGLGKQEHGRTDPIKVTLKMDKAGVGHDPGKEFTDHWWLRVFNEAAQKIGVKKDPVDEKETREKKMAEDKKNFYKGFVKSSTLTNGVETKDKGSDVSNGEDSDEDTSASPSIPTLDDIHKFCGGATGHRAARFGIKMKGKLARAAEHEKQFEEKLQKVKTAPLSSETSMIETPLDINLHGNFQETQPEDNSNIVTNTDISEDNSSNKKNKKKKKRKREELSSEDVNELPDNSVQEMLSQNDTNDTFSQQAGKKSKKKKQKQEVMSSEDINDTVVSAQETDSQPQNETESVQNSDKKNKKKKRKQQDSVVTEDSESIHIQNSTVAVIGEGDEIPRNSGQTEEIVKEKKKWKRDKVDAIDNGKEETEVKSERRKRRKKGKIDVLDESESLNDKKKKKRKGDICQEELPVSQEESPVIKKKKKQKYESSS